MSSTCYNPFLYAWLNENFRKEFKQVLPCFRANCSTVGAMELRNRVIRHHCNGSEIIDKANNAITTISCNDVNSSRPLISHQNNNKINTEDENVI